MRRRPSQRLPSAQGYKLKRPPRRRRKRSVSLGRRPKLRLPPRLPRPRRTRLRKTGRQRRHQMTMSKRAGTQTPTKRLRPNPRARLIRRKHYPQGPSRSSTTRSRHPRRSRKTNHQTTAQRPRGERRPWRGERSCTRLPSLHAPKTTSDRPFAVFLDTSILVRQSCLTRFVRPTSRKVKQVVSLSRLVPLTSPSRLLSKRRMSSTRTASSNSRCLVS